jgi:hypothetical protein
MMDLKKMKPGTRVTVTLSAQDLLVICSSLEPGRYDLVRPVMQSLEAQIFPQIEQRNQQEQLQEQLEAERVRKHAEPIYPQIE